MTAALRFFVLIEVLGLAATPLAAVAFARLPGRGLAFAKPLGLLLATWLVWVLGSVGVRAVDGHCGSSSWRCSRAAGALVLWRLRPEIPRGAFLWSEGLALGAFALMALLVAYSPDVWQTEKPMDMAFINAAGDATPLPARGPVDGGGGPQLLLLRAPDGLGARSGSPRWRRTWATTSRSRRSSRSRWSPRSGSPTRSAGAW